MPGDKPVHNLSREQWEQNVRLNRFSQPVAPTLPTPEDERLAIVDEYQEEWKKRGWTPEAVGVIRQLAASGMPISLAAIAAKDIMGLNSPGPSEWEQFEREQPTRAYAKKMLHKAGGAVKGITRPIWESKDMLHEAEKVSAADMLAKYLQAEDLQKVNQQTSQQLRTAATVPQARETLLVDPNTRQVIPPVR